MKQKDDFSCAPVAIRNWINSISFTKLSKNLLEDISFLLKTEEDGTDPDHYMSLIRIIAMAMGEKVKTFKKLRPDTHWSAVFLEYTDSSGDEHIAFAEWNFTFAHWVVENSQIMVNGKMKKKFSKEEINRLCTSTNGLVHEVK